MLGVGMHHPPLREALRDRRHCTPSRGPLTEGQFHVVAMPCWNMSLPELYQVATTWTLGIEAQDEKLDHRSTFDTVTDSVEASRSQQGYYTQFLLNWQKQATLQAGVRVEDSSTFGVEANPRVAASYTLPWTQTKLQGVVIVSRS